MKVCRILGVRIHAITQEELTTWLRFALRSKQFHHIVTPNPEFLMQAKKDDAFRKILNQADLAIPDGFGLKIASWGLGGPLIPTRITGTDTLNLIAELCVQRGQRMVLFGGFHHVAMRAAQALKKRHPGLRVKGLPDAGDIRTVQEKAEWILQQIQNLKPDILIVALGSPKQDQWIAAYRECLSTVKVAMGVGGGLDYLSGEKKRAPKIMRNLGFEWLFRFLQEPRRIRRMVVATIQFPYEVMKSKVLSKNHQMNSHENF